MKKRWLFVFILLFSVAFLSACSIGGQTDISKLDAVVNEETIVYDGSEKFTDVSLYSGRKLVATISANGESKNFDVEYSNNVNAGTARIVITAKEDSKKFKGRKTVEFVILPAQSISVQDAESLVQATQFSNYLQITLESDIIVPSTNSLQIPSTSQLNLNGHVLECETTINNYGKIYMSDGSQIIARRAFTNRGTITSENQNAAIYFDNLSSFSLSDNKIATYFRNQINGTLEYYQTYYDGTHKEPAVSVANAEEWEYSFVYSDNLNVGTASVTLTANRFSHQYYGEKILNFNINVQDRTVTNDDELSEIMLDPNNTLITLSGTFNDVLIPSGYTFRTSNSANILGNLTISENSTLTVTANGKLDIGATNTKIDNYGNIFNYGTLKTFAPLNNHSNFTNYNVGQIYLNEQFKNENLGVCINSGTLYIEKPLNNGGSLTNKGSLYLLSSEGNQSQYITNEGIIITDSEIDFSEKRIYVRRPITQDDASLSATEFYYTGSNQSPYKVNFKTGQNYKIVADSDYTKQTIYEGTSYNAVTTIRPGTINYVISFDKYKSKSYTGSLTMQYIIHRGIYQITATNGDYQFQEVFTNENWKTALIKSELQCSFDITIPADKEIKINEQGSLVMSGNLTVNGALNNYGQLAFTQTSGNQISIDNGQINNYSKMYFNEIAQTEIINNEGNIYKRIPLLESYIEGFPTTLEYNTVSTYGLMPEFEVKVADTVIPRSQNYNVKYENNKRIGTARAEISAGDFSQTFYSTSKIYKSFTITRGEVTVTSYDMFKSAISLVSNDVCNFHTIHFGNSLTKTINKGITSNTIETITIYADTVIDMGEYSLNLKISESSSGTQKAIFKLVNNGTIRTSKFINYTEYSGSGKILGYTNNIDDLCELTKMCHEIYLTGNISLASYSDYTLRPNKQHVMIDLMGYTISDSMSLFCNNYNLTITSSQGKGTISRGLKIEYLSSSNNITLENLNIKNFSNGGFSCTTRNCTFT